MSFSPAGSDSSFKVSALFFRVTWLLGVKFSSTLCPRSLPFSLDCANSPVSLFTSPKAVSSSSLRCTVSFCASIKLSSATEILFSFSVSSFSNFWFSSPLLSKRLSRLERLLWEAINASERFNLSSSMAAILRFIERISRSLGDMGPLSLFRSMLCITLSRSSFSTCDALRARLMLSTFSSAVENLVMDRNFSSSSFFEICAILRSSERSLSSPSRASSCVPILSCNRLEVSTRADSMLSKRFIWCLASCISFAVWELSSFSCPRRVFSPSVTILSVSVVSCSIGRLLSGSLVFLLARAFSTPFRTFSFSSFDSA